MDKEKTMTTEINIVHWTDDSFDLNIVHWTDGGSEIQIVHWTD
jgi:hypothetical protein